MQQLICNTAIIKDPTTPQALRFTTVRNITIKIVFLSSIIISVLFIRWGIK